MEGDKILIEAYHVKAAQKVVDIVLPKIIATDGKYTMTVAGESGCGKSEIAMAIANILAGKGIKTVIFQQDDYFVYPPKTNDKTRRKDINWVGAQEVHLDKLNASLAAFLAGEKNINKPLVIFNEDRITQETMSVGEAKVAIAEGTYTTLLKNVNSRIFINRDYYDTKAHRVKRLRNKFELDAFITKVLLIEHNIISKHKANADIIITKDYSVKLSDT